MIKIKNKNKVNKIFVLFVTLSFIWPLPVIMHVMFSASRGQCTAAVSLFRYGLSQDAKQDLFGLNTNFVLMTKQSEQNVI